jgi:hypothetical protein
MGGAHIDWVRSLLSLIRPCYQHSSRFREPEVTSGLNCWVLHPVARVSSNAFLKTIVRNNVSVLDFIVHYLLHVSAPIGGHLQVKCTQNILR